MKSFIKISSISILSLSLFACNNASKTPAADANLSNLHDSASYAIGISMGASLAESNLDSLNMSAFLAGFDDAADPESFKIPMSELNLVIETFIVSELKKNNQVTIQAGEQFLAENGKRDGVTTTASGLQYEFITKGTGTIPAMYDSVTVHYHGTKLDGSVFDSSKGGDPITFSLAPGALIQGWIEGMTSIPVGSTVKLYVPSDLGYGMQGMRSIKPFETLVFEIELLDSKKGAAPQFDPAMLQQMQMQQQ